MTEQLRFVFDGKLASSHQMDFYEFARFQYSASRLFVKLDNYRRTGGFPRRITYDNEHKIVIQPFREGSFGLDLLAPVAMEGVRLAYELPISALFGYLVDRVFRSADDDVIRAALATQDRLIDSFNNNINGRDDTISQTIGLLRTEIDQNRDLTEQNRLLLERLNAETERRAYLQGQQDILAQISREDDAELVSMAAPLLKEMNVPLRGSASSVSVSRRSDGRTTNLLFANKTMADEVDVAVVDRDISTIDIDVIQYNKENGWGKFRNDEWDGPASLNVPADIKDRINAEMVWAMNQEQVEVDCYFVRSAAGIPQRIIVFDVREIDEL